MLKVLHRTIDERTVHLNAIEGDFRNDLQNIGLSIGIRLLYFLSGSSNHVGHFCWNNLHIICWRTGDFLDFRLSTAAIVLGNL